MKLLKFRYQSICFVLLLEPDHQAPFSIGQLIDRSHVIRDYSKPPLTRLVGAGESGANLSMLSTMMMMRVDRDLVLWPHVSLLHSHAASAFCCCCVAEIHLLSDIIIIISRRYYSGCCTDGRLQPLDRQRPSDSGLTCSLVRVAHLHITWPVNRNAVRARQLKTVSQTHGDDDIQSTRVG